MEKSIGILSNNQLKIIAIIAMTCDHIGKQIFTDISFLQIFGRIAFPIFAYMIAEGCKYTKNRKRYLLSMASLAVGCQVFYYIAERSLYQCVLVTFSLSIALIYIVDNAIKKKNAKSVVLVLTAFAVVFMLTEVLPKMLTDTDFNIDYNLWGVLLPVFVFMVNKKTHKLIITAVSLIFISVTMGGMQWYSLISLLLLVLYNGKRGNVRMKNFFYVYYPLHLAVIYLISIFV